MTSFALKLCFASFIVILTSGIGVAQMDTLPDASSRSGRARRDRPVGLDEMLAKQRAERARKEHEQMLERGEQALRLANQLEASFNQSGGFSKQDRAKLESLERVVLKIRNDLGGGDDDDERNDSIGEDLPKPSTLEEAFSYLKTTTVKLVDELKKTTRFSISAVAIQTSNSVLKLVKFLRIGK